MAPLNRYKESILGYDDAHDASTKLVLKRALYGAKFLEESGRLDYAKHIGPSEQDADFFRGIQGRVLNVDADGTPEGKNVIVADLLIDGKAKYVTKACALGENPSIATQQSAARSLWLPCDKQLRNAASRVDSYFAEPKTNTLTIYQDKLPFTLSDALGGLHEEFAAGKSDPNLLLSTAYLFQELASTMQTINSAQYVDRDMKPANYGVTIVSSEDGNMMYDMRVIDVGEFVAINGLQAKMTPHQQESLNRSDALTIPYAPTRMLRAFLGDDGDLETQMHDNIIGFGHILRKFLCKESVSRRGTVDEIAQQEMDLREQFISDRNSYLIQHEAFLPYLDIVRKATDEELVQSGKYTMYSLLHDLSQATTMMSLYVMPEMAERELDFKPFMPTKKHFSKDEGKTVYFGQVQDETKKVIRAGDTIHASQVMAYETIRPHELSKKAEAKSRLVPPENIIASDTIRAHEVKPKRTENDGSKQEPKFKFSIKGNQQ